MNKIVGVPYRLHIIFFLKFREELATPSMMHFIKLSIHCKRNVILLCTSCFSQKGMLSMSMYQFWIPIKLKTCNMMCTGKQRIKDKTHCSLGGISVPCVQSIAAQDEKNQLLTTCMWFNLVWTDYQLSWNSSEYGDVDSVVIQPRNRAVNEPS